MNFSPPRRSVAVPVRVLLLLVVTPCRAPCPAAAVRRLPAGRAAVLPRALRGVEQAGRTHLRRQLHDLDSAGREDAARRHRAPARLRRGVVQVGADGRVRPALAGAGEEARLCAAGSRLRATGEGRLPDVVRPAQRLERGVPEVPRRSRREVGPSRTGQGAVGAVGAQRRRALGRRHGDAASGPRRRGLAALGRAAVEAEPGAAHDQGAHPAGRGAQGADDVQPRHEGRRHRQGRPLRRRLARERGVLQRGSRQGRAHRRGRRSADESRVRQPALPRDPVARRLPDRPAAEDARAIRSNAMPTGEVWLALPTGTEAVPAAKFAGDPLKAAWLPNEAIAKAGWSTSRTRTWPTRRRRPRRRTCASRGTR